MIGLKTSRGRVSIGPDFSNVAEGAGVDGPIARTTLDIALALDAMSGYEPAMYGGRAAAGRSSTPLTSRSDGSRSGSRSTPRSASRSTMSRGVAARQAAALLAELGHDVVERVPDWDDDGFPEAWATIATGGMQHIIRVIERLHGRPANPDALEPATRGWLLGMPTCWCRWSTTSRRRSGWAGTRGGSCATGHLTWCC